jgi:NTE family protein
MKKYLLLFSLLVFRFINAQPPVEIKNLVFEAAGIRGIAYCGAIQEMEAKNLMNNVEKLAGTSSGSITALAISLGYKGKELEKIVSKTNFKKFNDGGFFFIGGLTRIKKYFGWYKGKKIERWLGKIIEEKTGDAEITFEQLRQKGFKELYIAGTALNKQRAVIFSHETYPDMKVKDAVRISIGIPLYFEAVFIDSTGRVFTRPKQKDGLDVMVDGGFLENYPIHVFDKAGPDMFTIGFRIDANAQIKNDRDKRQLAEVPISNTSHYFRAFYNLVIETMNRQHLTDADWRRTISISDGDTKPRIRKLSKDEITILLENGRKAVREYFD